ncbi:transcriptional regulator, Crp family [Trichinella spiralis]|uniref:transcriptional regulator, Crp family n=1 Tax=Trichinella spiralis TaxID=6334 RepID=UPI0001EFE715|nr:transcriptional regulator, Crp family [Trichinella spiralis]
MKLLGSCMRNPPVCTVKITPSISKTTANCKVISRNTQPGTAAIRLLYSSNRSSIDWCPSIPFLQKLVFLEICKISWVSWLQGLDFLRKLRIGFLDSVSDKEK